MITLLTQGRSEFMGPGFAGAANRHGTAAMLDPFSRNRKFESTSLQRGVYKLSVPQMRSADSRGRFPFELEPA
jgi:hypothetical protein